MQDPGASRPKASDAHAIALAQLGHTMYSHRPSLYPSQPAYRGGHLVSPIMSLLENANSAPLLLPMSLPPQSPLSSGHLPPPWKDSVLAAVDPAMAPTTLDTMSVMRTAQAPAWLITAESGTKSQLNAATARPAHQNAGWKSEGDGSVFCKLC